MKIFPDSAKVNEIRCNRAGQCWRINSSIVPLRKLLESFIDFCAGKTLKPLVKLTS